MKRKLRAVGLILLACFALTAFAASSASAAKLVGSAGATAVFGSEVGFDEFTFTDNSSLSAECIGSTFNGSIPAGGTSTPVLHPQYGSCSAFGLGASITTFGCDYEFHLGTFSVGGTPASMDIECGAGAIVITALTCELKIRTQQGLVFSTGTNVSGGFVDLDLNILSIAYEVTKDGIGCPLKAVGKYSKGDYRGTLGLTPLEGTLKIE